MFGQIWQATVPTAQSFLRAVTSTDQPGDFEHVTTRQAELTKADTLTSSNSGTKDSTSLASITKDATIQTDQVTRQGPLQNEHDIPVDLDASSEPSTVPAWKQKIMDKNEANKKEINEIGDGFTNKAIDRIAKMPEERRDKAAEEYLRSTDYIMKSVKRVMDFSANISSYF